MRHHIVITGTGRAGTTFLVELLTMLGFDTGIDEKDICWKKNANARAGLEHNLRLGDAPYIVKDPAFCDYAGQITDNDDIVIDHVYVPIRELTAAAESRRYVSSQGHVAGGLWGTDSMQPGDQERVLAEKLYEMLFALSGAFIPVTFLKYPDMIWNRAYLYKKLMPLLKRVSLDWYLEVFDKVYNPKIMHDFEKNGC